MKIQPRNITIRDLVEDYFEDDDGEMTGVDGVTGYGGNLDIRPPFQRNFIYKDKERLAVIDSVIKGFPLSLIYWADKGDDTFEVIDGQQRTISIAQFVEGDFSINDRYFHNLSQDMQDMILDYELMVHICSGTDDEKLEWFKRINIAGKALSNQELRNAVYAGSWVSDAKRYFSRRNCVAHRIGGDYLAGPSDRQKYLETVIKWISDGNIEDYMAQHQHDTDAEELWKYFQNVISWVKATFTRYRSAMKGVDWGKLYNEYKDVPLNPRNIEAQTTQLIHDDDVQKQKGIYAYILTGDEKHLGIRAFTAGMRQRVYERQDGKCAICGEYFDIGDMEADHIVPWSEGGKTIESNCQMLCKPCHKAKSAK